MPIIDGYRATHLLRHHSPFQNLSRNIPIVAMTASAIQGDREKCKKAGMDDYLAKPVKGKTLEKMLVRWAVNRRVERPNSDASFDDCEESEQHNCGTDAVPMFGQGKSHHSSTQHSALDKDLKPNEKSRPNINKRQNSHSLTLPGPESEADRVERREEAEEKATALRDEKLVGAALGTGTGSADRVHTLAHGHGHGHEHEQNGGQALTEENVGKLEREGSVKGENKNPRERTRRNKSLGADSLAAVADEKDDGDEDSDEESGPFGSVENSNLGAHRPRVERRWRDSERTVTGK